MAKKPGIFPTFFISGFECSTFLWKDQGRRNLVAETQHDKFVRDEWLNNGICDLHDCGGELRRVPAENYITELRRWQKELNRVTALDEDPFSDPVELQDVIEAAKRLRTKPDVDWS